MFWFFLKNKADAHGNLFLLFLMAFSRDTFESVKWDLFKLLKESLLFSAKPSPLLLLKPVLVLSVALQPLGFKNELVRFFFSPSSLLFLFSYSFLPAVSY